METRDQIYELVRLKYDHEADPGQEQELERWRNESEENQREYLQLFRLMQLADNLQRMKRIDPDRDLTVVRKKLKRSRKAVESYYGYFMRIASVLVIPLLLVCWWALFRDHPSGPLSANRSVYETALGVRSKIQLSDGTKVWLNSGSRLSFPEKFEKGRREVSLQGEAFFEVASDAASPFSVDLDGFKVKATGTKFNITGYPDDTKCFTYLSQGKVSVIREGFQALDMRAGQAVVLDRENGACEVLDQADEEKFLGWIRGRLIFRNDYMDQVAVRLGRWFNADIEVTDPELYDIFFTATFVNETLEQAMDLLSRSSPLRYRIEPGVQHRDGSFSRKKVLLMSK